MTCSPILASGRKQCLRLFKQLQGRQYAEGVVSKLAYQNSK